MPKIKLVFVCKNCGSESSRWEGQCKACGEWNTLEQVQFTKKSASASLRSGMGLAVVENLSDIKIDTSQRYKTGISEFDRTIGGGFVKGQVILISGTPGVGKSTLLLQIANGIDLKALYISAEESTGQISIRAERMGLKEKSTVSVSSASNVDEILQLAEKFDFCVIDSIQTVFSADIEASAGSVSQIRESALRLISFAKMSSKVVVIVGHITKEGVIAGPKLLEHMVDTVLYLEGDKNHIFRLLRVDKNRFGDDSEVGIFEMTQTGLNPVDDVSARLGSTSGSESLPGSATAVVLEGRRPIALEIQALTTKTAFGYPKRAASGYSLNRLSLLCAVIQKNLSVNLLDQDVYVNVASGVNIKEPGADLAVCAAIISSVKNKAVQKSTAFFGEVGLLGEIRNVIASDKRIKESKTLGYKNILSSQKLKNIAEIQRYLI